MVGDEKKAFVRMNPVRSDECVKKMSDGVVGLKVKCVVARDKGDGGEREEGDGGRGVVWLVRCGSGWSAKDSDLEVFDIGDDGVVAELSGNPVDGYE